MGGRQILVEGGQELFVDFDHHPERANRLFVGSNKTWERGECGLFSWRRLELHPKKDERP